MTENCLCSCWRRMSCSVFIATG